MATIHFELTKITSGLLDNFSSYKRAQRGYLLRRHKLLIFKHIFWHSAYETFIVYLYKIGVWKIAIYTTIDHCRLSVVTLNFQWVLKIWSRHGIFKTTNVQTVDLQVWPWQGKARLAHGFQLVTSLTGAFDKSLMKIPQRVFEIWSRHKIKDKDLWLSGLELRFGDYFLQVQITWSAN